MKYRIENIKSGIDLGIFEAESPEEALAAMYRDAGCADGQPPEYDGGIPDDYDSGLRVYEEEAK